MGRRCLDEGKVTLATEAVLGLVAMTMVFCCYDNMSRLLWRYVTIAMEIDGGCYGNKVWLC